MSVAQLPIASTRRSASAAAASLAASLVAGGAVVYAPRLLVVVPLMLVAVAAYVWPRATLVGVLVAVALYRGVYLAFRVNVGGFPLSALDLLPLPILISAGSMRLRAGARRSVPGIWLTRSLWLLVLGLVIGLFVGFASAASSYQLLRVMRVELLLISGLVAALIAGDTVAWRSAVRRGMLLAGAAAAIQILVSFVYAYATGRSFWLLFPFGSGTTEIDSAVRSGSVNVLRTNDVPTYAMLPAFCVAVMRASARHMALAGLIVAASIVSLSRGFWAGVAITCVVLAVRHFSARGLGLATLARWTLAVGAAAFLTFSFAGHIVRIRFDQARTVNDTSAAYRSAETMTALRSLSASPLTFAAGTGAGVTSTKAGLISDSGDPTNSSSFLENSLLSRWTNLSILSPLGAIALLLAAAAAGWRLSTALPASESELGLMGLCLPAILIGGVVGGTLESQATLISWVLAATLLATRTRGEEA